MVDASSICQTTNANLIIIFETSTRRSESYSKSNTNTDFREITREKFRLENTNMSQRNDRQ